MPQKSFNAAENFDAARIIIIISDNESNLREDVMMKQQKNPSEFYKCEMWPIGAFLNEGSVFWNLNI